MCDKWSLVIMISMEQRHPAVHIPKASCQCHEGSVWRLSAPTLCLSIKLRKKNKKTPWKRERILHDVCRVVLRVKFTETLWGQMPVCSVLSHCASNGFGILLFAVLHHVSCVR